MDGKAKPALMGKRVPTFLADGKAKLALMAKQVPTFLADGRAKLALMAKQVPTFLTPLLRPALLASALLAFVHSWDELVLVLFVAGRRVMTLPRRMWDGINDTLDPSLAGVAVLLIAVSVVLLTLGSVWRRNR